MTAALASDDRAPIEPLLTVQEVARTLGVTSTGACIKRSPRTAFLT